MNMLSGSAYGISEYSDLDIKQNLVIVSGDYYFM